MSPVELALAFTEAWTGHDLTTAAGYLSDDVVFDGPMNHTAGADAYVEGLAAFARAVTGMRVVAALGDDHQALIMYEVDTAPFGTLTCAEHLTIRDGKIHADRLTFDTAAVRKAGAGQDPLPS
jgi:SnoaL-like domain